MQLCAADAGGNKLCAIHLFKQRWTGCAVPRPGRVYDTWAQRTGVTTAHRGGRPPLLNQRAAKFVAAALQRGWMPDRYERHGFRGLRHAVEYSPKLRRFLRRRKVSARTVVRAAERVDPDLRKVPEQQIVIKPGELRALRMQVAAALLKRFPFTMQCTEWIDESSWSPTKETYKVWGSARAGVRSVHNPRLVPSKRQRVRLHFAVTCNYAVGAHKLVWLRDSAGDGKKFPVRT